MRGLDAQWQADLADLPHFVYVNDGYRYILTVIDVFSRYAFARALKRKTGVEVAEALETIFKESKRQPHYLQTDEGKEFFNQRVQHILNQREIKLFSVYNENKAALVERLNRTIKDKMYRYFTYTGSNRWIDVLPDLIASYNSSTHSSIKCAPDSVTKANEADVWLEQYQDLKPATKTRFKMGDVVRIAKAKTTFNRGFTPNWSHEEFKIASINTKYAPPMYELRDVNSELLRGGFYEQELQLVNNTDQIYVIEKVIRTKGKGKQKQALVKWKGYRETSWIPFDRVSTLQNINKANIKVKNKDG